MAHDVQIIIIILTILGSCKAEFGLNFTKNPVENTIAVPGSLVTLECSTNFPFDKLEWHHNHHLIPKLLISSNLIDATLGEQPYRVVSDQQKSFLEIYIDEFPELYEKKSGIYLCIASVGSIKLASRPSRLTVAEIEPFFEGGRETSVTIPVGEAVKIPCHPPTSVPVAEISFTKDGQLIIDDEETTILTEDGNLLLFTTLNSHGEYRCHATNVFLNKTLSSPYVTTLNIADESNNIELSREHIVNPNFEQRFITAGGSTRLHCLLSGGNGRYQPSIRLARLPESNHSSDNYVTYKRYSNSALSTLIINNITRHDRGKYVCHEQRGDSNVSSSLELHVEEPPQIITPFPPLLLSEGDILNVSCSVIGWPKPIVYWLTNGEMLTKRDNIFINSDNQLTIQNVTKDLAGVLQCFAHNAAGSDYSTTSVTITPNTVQQTQKNSNQSDSNYSGENRKKKQHRNVSPSRPTVKKISADAVELCWNVPNFSTVVYFKIQHKLMTPHNSNDNLPSTFKHSHKKWWTHWAMIPSNENCSVLTKLDAGNTYKFRIAAVYNSLESLVGRSSKKFFLTPGSVLSTPNTPLLVKIEAFASNQTIFIKWNHDSQIQTDGFMIFYKVLGLNESYHRLRYLGGERRQIFTHEIPIGKDIVVRIQAFNMGEDSELSNTLFLVSNQQKRNNDEYFNKSQLTETQDNKLTIPNHKSLNQIIPDYRSDRDYNTDERGDYSQEDYEDYNDDSGEEDYQEEMYENKNLTIRTRTISVSSKGVMIALIILGCFLLVILLVMIVASIIRCLHRQRRNSDDHITPIEALASFDEEISSHMCSPQSVSSATNSGASSPPKEQYQMRSLLNEPD